jgi:hypothetical protein
VDSQSSWLDTSSVTQTTESLLRQHMSEMKYLGWRDRVDAFPTGPIEAVSTLVLVPSLPLLLRWWKLLNKRTNMLPPGNRPCSTSGDQHIGKPAGFRDCVISCARPEECFIWGLPPTAGEPLLEPAAQIYVVWCTGSAEPRGPSSFS